MDIFVANHPEQNNFLYRNNGDGTFLKVTSKEIVEDSGSSYGSGWGDFDNDGDIDLCIANYDQNNFLYSNNEYQKHWINIQCVGTVSNTAAIGARVRVKATISGEPVWQMSQVSGQTGYLSKPILQLLNQLCIALCLFGRREGMNPTEFRPCDRDHLNRRIKLHGA